MKMKNIFKLLIFMAIIILGSCEEKTLGPVIQNDIPPGPVEIKTFTAIPGGFDVSYKLPDDKDLLYVKAEYFIKEGEKSEVKASFYQNSLMISGFGDTSERTVKLYAVDRSANVSEPVEFTGSPLEAPVNLIQESLIMAPDFGGAKFTWVNLAEAPVSIMIYAEDSLGVIQLQHIIYTSVDSGRYSIRGFEPVPTRFFVVVRDRWDNFSDPKYPESPDSTITPMYEARLDKTKFRKVILPNDTDWNAWEGRFESGYDEDYQSFTHSQGDHSMPQIMTIDLGVKVRLSRFVVHQRGLEQSFWAYSHGNPKRYDVYGSVELPDDGTGDLNNWIQLRDQCISVKPSGLPNGQNSDEDMIHFFQGDEYSFEVPIEIRYFRFAVQETWDGAGFINFSELTFFGDIIEEIN